MKCCPEPAKLETLDCVQAQLRGQYLHVVMLEESAQLLGPAAADAGLRQPLLGISGGQGRPVGTQVEILWRRYTDSAQPALEGLLTGLLEGLQQLPGAFLANPRDAQQVGARQIQPVVKVADRSAVDQLRPGR